ncbi:MAG: threonine dehydratase [Pseudohongiellaceae bacterium]|jgi:threonine dehydratase
MVVSIKDIEDAAARIYDVALETPVSQSHYLNEALQAEVFFKLENQQHIGAFKFRGAYNRLCQLNTAEKAKGVVAFSSGNHAQGIAYAAKLLGMHATIVMPTDAPNIKKNATQALGAEIIFYDRHTQSREEIAADIADSTGAVLVPAFDDPYIIAGQGTCALELMRQLQDRRKAPDVVISPVGGGGLMAGVSTVVKALSPKTAVIGVEPEHFDDHRQSKSSGERVKITGTSATLCDSLMATMPGELTWAINSKLVDQFLVVSEAEVAHAVSYAFRYLKQVIEPGGAVGLAALLHNKLPVKGLRVAVILSGGNIDNKLFIDCLNKFPNP